jgi:DNA-binding response OmpR family regulator
MSFPVFLVEDEPKLCAMIGEAINGICDALVVGTAETEADAVEWLNSHRGDWRLAVLDLFLKTGTGFGVLGRLDPRSATEQVIVLTNSATKENRDRCLEMGALAVYDKTAEFEQFLDHCLRHHQQAHGA